MRLSDRQHVGKIFQCMHTEETGKNFDTCYVLSGIIQKQCIDMENVHGIVDESRHSSRARFLRYFGHLQEHKIRKHRECVQHRRYATGPCSVDFLCLLERIDVGSHRVHQVCADAGSDVRDVDPVIGAGSDVHQTR